MFQYSSDEKFLVIVMSIMWMYGQYFKTKQEDVSVFWLFG